LFQKLAISMIVHLPGRDYIKHVGIVGSIGYYLQYL